MDSRYFGRLGIPTGAGGPLFLRYLSPCSLAANAKGERRDQEYVSLVTLCMEGV